MVSNFSYQNILFLKNISLDDIIEVEDIYQKELLNNINILKIGNPNARLSTKIASLIFLLIISKNYKSFSV